MKKLVNDLTFIFTLNPGLHTAEMIEQLAHMALEAGIKMIGRLNMSFFNATSDRCYAEFVGMFCEVMEHMGLEGIWEIDTPGHKLRLGDNVPELHLEVGQYFVLTPYPQEEHEMLAADLPYLWWFAKYVSVGELILLGDDDIRLRVEALEPDLDRIVTKVEQVRDKGTKLRKKMGVTIRREDLPLPLISSDDEAVMRFGAKHKDKIKLLGISMICNAQELAAYKEWIADNCPDWPVLIIPKLESASAWANMEAIVSKAKAAMFPKGDGLAKAIVLGRAHELPRLEEYFIQLTRQYNVISVLATGLLDWPISQAGLDSLYYIAKYLQPKAMLFPEIANLGGSKLLEFVSTAIKVVREAQK